MHSTGTFKIFLAVIAVSTCAIACAGQSSPGTCLLQAARSINDSVQRGNDTDPQNSVETTLRFLTNCLSESVNGFSGGGQGDMLTVVTPAYDFLWEVEQQAALQPFLRRRMLQFEEVAEDKLAEYVLVSITQTDMLWTDVDGMFLDMASIAQLQDENITCILDDMVKATTELEWNDVLPAVRDYLVSFNNAVYALPLTADMLMLYYREDLFKAANERVPETWEELLDVARRLNGTTVDGNGNTAYGICLDMGAACHLPTWLMAVASSYLQTHGTWQGAWFDLDSMKPLLGSPAFSKAAQILEQLAHMTPHHPHTSCEPQSSSGFLHGDCAMTIELSSFFMLAAKSSESVVSSNFNVARLPGSKEVLDRTSWELVNCTEHICKNAKKGHNGDLINAPVFSPTSIHPITVNCHNEDEGILMRQVISWMSSPLLSTPLVLQSNTSLAPFRRSHLNITLWVNEGYSEKVTRTYLAIIESVLSSEDLVVELRLPAAQRVRRLIDDHMLRVLDGSMQADEASTKLSTAITDILSREKGPRTQQLLYRLSLNVPRTSLQVPKNSLSLGLVLPAILVPCMLTIFLAFITVFGMMYFKKETARLGRAFAPNVGPDSTLLITDIQDSTTLWEILPARVMDIAVREHQQVIRRLLQKHFGYESATEGDSFIVAFHTPRDALLFSLDTQQALLTADWPGELLEPELCSPVWVRYVPSELDTLVHTTDRDPLQTKERLLKGQGSRNAADAFGLNHESLKNDFQSMKKSKSTGFLQSMFGAETRSASQTIPATREMMPLDSAEFLTPPILENSDETTVPPSEDAKATSILFQEACTMTWEKVEVGTPKAVLIFRGLRVRIGMHSGISGEEQLLVNNGDSRVHYSGKFSQAAKAVSDAAHGCIVTLSEATHKRLQEEDLPDTTLLLHCGEHKLTDCPSIVIYQAVHFDLRGRLGHLPKIRSLSSLSPGVFEAPLGHVTVVALSMQGVTGHQTWDASMNVTTVRIFHDLAAYHLKKYSAYLMEASGSCVLAAFGSAVDSVFWCLEVRALMMHLPGLAEQESRILEERICGAQGAALPHQAGPCQMKAMRVKAGIDTNHVLASIDFRSGKLRYQGRAANRALRIAHAARPEQILCSGEAHACCMAQNGSRMLMDVEMTHVGSYRMKGASGQMQIYSCSYLGDDEDEDDYDMGPDDYETTDMTDDETLLVPAHISAALLSNDSDLLDSSTDDELSGAA